MEGSEEQIPSLLKDHQTLQIPRKSCSSMLMAQDLTSVHHDLSFLI